VVIRRSRHEGGGADGLESGVALLWALLATTAVAASLLLVAAVVASRQPSGQYDYRSVVLTALSDAAMAETLAELDSDPGFLGIEERQFGAGRVSSSVSATPFGLRLVTAVGEYQGWRSVVRAEIAIDPVARVIKVDRRMAFLSRTIRP
jgi:hypothetical protein